MDLIGMQVKIFNTVN